MGAPGKFCRDAQGQVCPSMRIFHFFRHEDASGVGGTGVVAEGVEFTNGWCAVRWLSQTSSVTF